MQKIYMKNEKWTFTLCVEFKKCDGESSKEERKNW